MTDFCRVSAPISIAAPPALPEPSPPGVIEEMARKAAHDLRAPVRQIKSFAMLLLEDLGPDVTPEAAQDVEHILQGADRLHALINGLSDLALVDAKTIELEAIPVSCGLHPDESSIRINLPDPPPLVLADFEMLRLLWEHLLLATEKLSLDAAAPEVTVEPHANGEIVIQAALTRPAFALHDVMRAFQPFPAHPGHPRDPGASLAICRRAAERMGGRATAQKLATGGLSIEATLPRPSSEDSVSN